MPEALTRAAPNLLPVLYDRADALAAAQRQAAARQAPTLEQRAEEFRAEPPRTELRFKKGGRPEPGPVDNPAPFTAQQFADAATPTGLLPARRPLLSGYAAYKVASRHGDPGQPRPGQSLDVSV